MPDTITFTGKIIGEHRITIPSDEYDELELSKGDEVRVKIKKVEEEW